MWLLTTWSLVQIQLEEKKDMETIGFEPITLCLQNIHSTLELCSQNKRKRLFVLIDKYAIVYLHFKCLRLFILSLN